LLDLCFFFPFFSRSLFSFSCAITIESARAPSSVHFLTIRRGSVARAGVRDYLGEGQFHGARLLGEAPSAELNPPCVNRRWKRDPLSHSPHRSHAVHGLVRYCPPPFLGDVEYTVAGHRSGERSSVTSIGRSGPRLVEAPGTRDAACWSSI